MAGIWGAVDFRHVDHREDLSEHQEVETAFITDLASLISVKVHEKEFLDAKLEKNVTWEKNEFFQEAPYKRQSLIGTKWVHTIKYETRCKARLVAKGFQFPDSDSIVKFSPSCGRDFFRIAVSLYSIVANWTFCQALDIKTAFSQCLPIRRNVSYQTAKRIQRHSECVENQKVWVRSLWCLQLLVWTVVEWPASLWWRQISVWSQIFHMGRQTEHDLYTRRWFMSVWNHGVPEICSRTFYKALLWLELLVICRIVI